jgi:hypothetical protein
MMGGVATPFWMTCPDKVSWAEKSMTEKVSRTTTNIWRGKISWTEKPQHMKGFLEKCSSSERFSSWKVKYFLNP